jgi:hypothetical protein
VWCCYTLRYLIGPAIWSPVVCCRSNTQDRLHVLRPDDCLNVPTVILLTDDQMVAMGEVN